MTNASKNSANLSGYTITEDLYKPDLELLDRYISFSAEINRISIASLGVIGFIVGILFKNVTPLPIIGDNLFFVTALGSIVFLALASAFALGHRYYATDAMHHQIRIYRYKTIREEIENPGLLQNKINKEERDRDLDFKVSALLLLASCCLLAFGVVAVGMNFAAFLWSGYGLAGSHSRTNPVQLPIL